MSRRRGEEPPSRGWIAKMAAGLSAMDEREVRLALRRLPARIRRELNDWWPLWAHEGQLPPPGDWRVWMIRAGRGFGKTRAGAEWVSQVARSQPEARIALVAATAHDARRVMVEGESGLLAVARRPRPRNGRGRWRHARADTAPTGWWRKAQWHLLVKTDAGVVHADAALRRVVERPGALSALPWRQVGAWRMREE